MSINSYERTTYRGDGSCYHKEMFLSHNKTLEPGDLIGGLLAAYYANRHHIVSDQQAQRPKQAVRLDRDAHHQQS